MIDRVIVFSYPLNPTLLEPEQGDRISVVRSVCVIQVGGFIFWDARGQYPSKELEPEPPTHSGCVRTYLLNFASPKLEGLTHAAHEAQILLRFTSLD